MDLYYRLNGKWYHEFISVLEKAPVFGVYTVEVRDFPTPPDFMLKFVVSPKIEISKEDVDEYIREIYASFNLEMILMEKSEIPDIIGKTFEPEYILKKIEVKGKG